MWTYTSSRYSTNLIAARGKKKKKKGGHRLWLELMAAAAFIKLTAITCIRLT